MSGSPKISVVVPCYNFGHLVPYTLDSLLLQTYPNWECIVVDDGSKDDTPAVMARYAEQDARIRYIRQENQGPGAARNRGITECTGEYIQFLDADDLLEPEKLAYQVQAVTEDPTVDIVYGQTMNFTNKSDNPGDLSSLHPDPLRRPTVSGSGKEVVREFLQTTFFPSSSIIRRSLVMELNMIDRELIQSEDWDLYLRAAASGARFKYLGNCPPGTRALIRSHESNNTANFFRLQYYVIKMRQKFARNNSDPELLALNQKLKLINLEDLIFQIQDNLKRGERKLAIERSIKTFQLQPSLRYFIYIFASMVLSYSAYVNLTSRKNPNKKV